MSTAQYCNWMVCVVVFGARWMGKARCGVWTLNTDPIWSKPWGNSTFLQLTLSARPLPPHPGKRTHVCYTVQIQTHAFVHCAPFQPAVCLTISLSVCLFVRLSDSAFSPARHLFLQTCSLKGEPIIIIIICIPTLYIICILITAAVWKPNATCGRTHT